MAAEEAGATQQSTTDAKGPEHGDVLRIIAEVERSLGALRAQAGKSAGDKSSQDATAAESRQAALREALAGEVDRLKHEAERLGAERAKLLEHQTKIEAELAELRAACAVAEERARRAEEARQQAETAGIRSQIQRETDAIKALEAKLDDAQARATELERERNEAQHEVAVAVSKLTAVIKVTERHAIRENELETEVETLRAEVEAARKIERHGIRASDVAAVASAEEHVQQTLMPQLEAAAEFLRIRRARLNAIRQTLKRRTKAMRVLQQIYSAQPAILQAEAEAIATERAAVEAERLEVVAERKKLSDLRVEAERLITKARSRVSSARALAFAAVAVLAIAGAAWTSWHVAGIIAPVHSVASVELETTNRLTGAAVPDAMPIATWLQGVRGSDAFAGVVAAKLVDRGHQRTEADLAVKELATALQLESSGPTVRLTLRGGDPDRTVALLDAVVAAAVSEAARQPERKNDQIRLAVVGSEQEVGRTVVSRAMVLEDTTRLLRAGILFGMALTAAAGGAFLVARMLRAKRDAAPAAGAGTSPAAAH